MSAVLGCDPGVHGCVAVLTAEKGEVIYLRALKPDMKRRDLRAVLDAAAGIMRLYGGKDAFLERVGYMGRRIDKRTGKERKDGGQGAFTFGMVYGMLGIGLEDRGLTVYDVPPMLWQSTLGCLSGGDKNVTKRKAIELFGSVESFIHHDTADGLLIAEYGRRFLASTRGLVVVTPSK